MITLDLSYMSDTDLSACDLWSGCESPVRFELSDLEDRATPLSVLVLVAGAV
jgi:hypothetical protein